MEQHRPAAPEQQGGALGAHPPRQKRLIANESAVDLIDIVVMLPLTRTLVELKPPARRPLD